MGFKDFLKKKIRERRRERKEQRKVKKELRKISQTAYVEEAKIRAAEVGKKRAQAEAQKKMVGGGSRGESFLSKVGSAGLEFAKYAKNVSDHSLGDSSRDMGITDPFGLQRAPRPRKKSTKKKKTRKTSGTTVIVDGVKITVPPKKKKRSTKKKKSRRSPIWG